MEPRTPTFVICLCVLGWNPRSGPRAWSKASKNNDSPLLYSKHRFTLFDWILFPLLITHRISFCSNELLVAILTELGRVKKTFPKSTIVNVTNEKPKVNEVHWLKFRKFRSQRWRSSWKGSWIGHRTLSRKREIHWSHSRQYFAAYRRLIQAIRSRHQFRISRLSCTCCFGWRCVLSTAFSFPHEKISGDWIFVCAHNAKDQRCGVCGPKLIDLFRKKVEVRVLGLISYLWLLSLMPSLTTGKSVGR